MRPEPDDVQRYLAAGGVVIAPGGQHLLALLRPKRSGPGGRPEVRLPKGHVEPGEALLETARREVAEETGCERLQVLGDLGQQTVQFTWKGRQYVRIERYFLMRYTPGASAGPAERQFTRLWLSWEEALQRLSYAAEREWVRRARQAWLRST
jgi:8-oxo-dGTP pyrophosphatase MutT (NUDIX family)